MKRTTRRSFLAASAASLATPTLLRANEITVDRNMSGFMAQNWQDHFDALDRVTVLCDTNARALHYWNPENDDYRIYPTSVPQTDELTKRGLTEIVRKKHNPSWTPTANMRERDPSLPVTMAGGEVGNPLGTRAMYLAWPAYLIHGTHDTRKIGRRSSSGCIGLFNFMVEELYDITPVGTQVRVL